MIALSIVALFAFSTGAGAAELKVFAARAIWTVLQEIGPDFERATGHKLSVTTGLTAPGTALGKQIAAGEPFDVLFATPPVLDAFVKGGKLDADTRTILVSSDTGVGVRAGAPKPDIGTVDAFKQTLLKAKSITYLGVSPVPRMLEKIGIADEIKSKVVVPDDDIGSELVAKGEIELVIVVNTQILTTPGVDLVGSLPGEIGIRTAFGGAVSASAKAPDAARQLIQFLKSADAAKVMRAQGMNPLF
jgi:molybdate transport system substrate-binding protein